MSDSLEERVVAVLQDSMSPDDLLDVLQVEIADALAAEDAERDVEEDGVKYTVQEVRVILAPLP